MGVCRPQCFLIGKWRLVHVLVWMLAAVCDIEIFGHAAAVMLADEAAYYLRQTGLVGKLQAVGNMVDDYSRAAFGRQGIVGVYSVLVLGKEGRVHDLAYVMIEGTGSHELYVGPNACGGIAGEVAHG